MLYSEITIMDRENRIFNGKITETDVDREEDVYIDRNVLYEEDIMKFIVIILLR